MFVIVLIHLMSEDLPWDLVLSRYLVVCIEPRLRSYVLRVPHLWLLIRMKIS